MLQLEKNGNDNTGCFNFKTTGQNSYQIIDIRDEMRSRCDSGSGCADGREFAESGRVAENPLVDKSKKW